MTTVILVSLLAPIAAGALLLAAGRRLPKLVADARGIALQTVIVIVVMLGIAGAVAAVLLSTGGEVVTELENQDLSTQIATEAECDASVMRDSNGDDEAGDKNGNKCVWDAGTGHTFSYAVCNLRNGELGGTPVGKTCTTRHDIA